MGVGEGGLVSKEVTAELRKGEKALAPQQWEDILILGSQNSITKARRRESLEHKRRRMKEAQHGWSV